MKKIKFLLLFILTILFITGCTISSTDSTNKINPPKNNQSPIKGTWQVVKTIQGDLNKNMNNNTEEWQDKIFQFSEAYITLGDYFLEDPIYQIKRVNGKDYLLYSHKSFLKDFNIPDGDIEVITVIDKDKFFCEIVRLDDKELVLSISNYNLYLKRISGEVNNDISFNKEQQEVKNYNFQKNNEDDLIRSGVLIGLRTSLDGENNENSKNAHQYSYRTLWISSKNKKMNPVLETEDIIFPRRSGFWKIEVKRNTKDHKAEDFLYAYNILTDNIIGTGDIHFEYSDWAGKTGQVYKHINYIGNDYVSIESIGSGKYEYNDETWYESKLQILPIDNLSTKKNVKLIDLSGEDGVSTMKLGIQKTMDKLKIESDNILYRNELLDNFGLERKMGHWFFKGRINYAQEEELFSEDYNINIIPPSKLVIYDELYIPWTDIKDKVPGAIDAYSSPNKDILIVFTKHEIIVYGIQNGKIESTPLQRIDLNNNETVIMAEWATGDYVENWEKTINSLDNIE